MKLLKLNPNPQRGVTLVELMIALALGSIISVAIIQVMVSNRLTDDLNKSVASTQENGRFIITRLRNDILTTGYYDILNPDLNDAVDITEEGAFVRNNYIPLPGTFASDTDLGVTDGSGTASDTLVVGMQSLADCRGYQLGYEDETKQEFFVVNEYFLQNNSLRCRGYDGRYLRGQKVAEGHNSHKAITLLEDVLNFQVMYGITNTGNTTFSGAPVRYVDASQLAAALAGNAYVVSIKIALVIKGEGDGFIQEPATFKLLNEDSIKAPDKGLYKAFETTITLRNANYFVRGNS